MCGGCQAERLSVFWCQGRLASSQAHLEGLQFAIMTVRQLPPRESFRIRVSLELR